VPLRPQPAESPPVPLRPQITESPPVPLRPQPAESPPAKPSAASSAAPIQGTTWHASQCTHAHLSMRILLLRGMPPIATAPAPAVIKTIMSSPAASQPYAAPMPGTTCHL
jgi:hypothetical protein